MTCVSNQDSDGIEPDGVTIFSEVVRTNKSDEHLLVC